MPVSHWNHHTAAQQVVLGGGIIVHLQRGCTWELGLQADSLGSGVSSTDMGFYSVV